MSLRVANTALSNLIWVTLDSSYKSQMGCLHLADISLDLRIPLSAVCPPNSLVCPLSGLLTSLTRWIVSPLEGLCSLIYPQHPAQGDTQQV